MAAHRRELADVGRRQAVRPSVDAEREVDHVRIDADLRGDLPDAVDDPADHDGDPLVRLLDPGQRLLELLPAVEDAVDARPLDGDAVDDLLGRDPLYMLRRSDRRDHVDRARLVEQLRPDGGPSGRSPCS